MFFIGWQNSAKYLNPDTVNCFTHVTSPVLIVHLHDDLVSDYLFEN